MSKISSLFFIVSFVSIPFLLQAATSSFTVRTFYGDDMELPTVPDPVEAVPMAATQIDVSWGTSTDDTGIAGYQLFRNHTQIATTSLNYYYDTGLAASTTYTYFVRSFDVFEKVSSSSMEVSTTTFPAPFIAATSTSPGIATLLPLELTEFSIIPTANGVNFNWKTNLPSRYILRYGKNSVYEDGSLEGNIFKRNHGTSLFALPADTKYLYELYGYDRFGREVLLKRGDFRTLSLPDNIAPANVFDFTATPILNDVLLRWQNPPDNDFAYVKILKSHIFFPQSPEDGFLVYQGPLSAFTDSAALEDYGAQYYTVFAYDSSGNVSSGAVALASLSLPSSFDSEGSVETGISGLEEINATSSVILYADSVFINQEKILMTLADRNISLDANKSYLISIPFEAVPEHLKSIIVTVVNPTDNRKLSAYLLKLNDEKTFYEALLPPVRVAGESLMLVEVFDYNLATVRRISNTITFVEISQEKLSNSLSNAGIKVWSEHYRQIVLWGICLGLLLILFLLLLWRRRREDKT